MHERALQSIPDQRYLGLHVLRSLKVTSNIENMVQKAQWILAICWMLNKG